LQNDFESSLKNYDKLHLRYIDLQEEYCTENRFLLRLPNTASCTANIIFSRKQMLQGCPRNKGEFCITDWRKKLVGTQQFNEDEEI
jgi:hypothetical protein